MRAQADRDALALGRVEEARASFTELRGLDAEGAAELERELAGPCRQPVERKVPAGRFWCGLERAQAQRILDSVARRNYNLDLHSPEPGSGSSRC